ncbi:MAG: tannase/feruloyl esterase family alpha/beta hydrolase [Bacteroidales bacterium]
MEKKLLILTLFLGSLSIVSAQTILNSKACIPCEQLKEIKLPDVTILEVEETIEGHCRVLGRISKEINFELLLPKNWNNRFLMGGGGGFVGSITNQFRNSVDSGFATVGTDTGHEGPIQQASWALNNMERQLNFGRLAVHRTVTVSKAIIKAFYFSDPLYSYFLGASRGGGQAMIEAQLYPEDFNGIVAFAPAISWPAFGAKFVQNIQKIYPDPKNLNHPVITLDNLRLLHYYVLKLCDGLDGLKDSIINNPGDCKFDFSILPVCPDNKESSNCFTSQQLEAIKTIYSPVVSQKDTIYQGFPLGGENETEGWSLWITGSDTTRRIQGLQYYFGTDIFKYFVFNDPDWDYSKYTFSDYFTETKYASSFLDATQTDYSEFKKKGGKLIMVHGWSDPALSAFSTIEHYKAIAQKDKDLKSYVRLFLLPGVLHFQGGSGPDQADWIKLITGWVEKNEAPERVVLSKVKNKQIVMTRPVYPFPKKIEYDGTGNPDMESSFNLIKDQ